MDDGGAPSTPRRRPLRRAAAAAKSLYDESQFDSLLLPHLTPTKKSKSNVDITNSSKWKGKKKKKQTLASLQKETHKEALIALSLGFPIDSLLPSEPPPPPPFTTNDYIVVRNHVLATWRSNVSSTLSLPHLLPTIAASYDPLISAAFSFLHDNGFINFGVIRNPHPPDPGHPDKGSVLIVGSGLAGLAAATQLIRFGFKVLILEGRTRPGGRVYSMKVGNAGVDLGGSVITGVHATPWAF